MIVLNGARATRPKSGIVFCVKKLVYTLQVSGTVGMGEALCILEGWWTTLDSWMSWRDVSNQMYCWCKHYDKVLLGVLKFRITVKKLSMLEKNYFFGESFHRNTWILSVPLDKARNKTWFGKFFVSPLSWVIFSIGVDCRHFIDDLKSRKDVFLVCMHVVRG